MKKFILPLVFSVLVLVFAISCDMEGTTILSNVPGWLRGQTISIENLESSAADGQRYLTKVSFSTDGRNMTLTYATKGSSGTKDYGFIAVCNELPNCSYGGSGSPEGPDMWDLTAVYPGWYGSTVYSMLTFELHPDTGNISARCSSYGNEYSFLLLPVTEK